MNRFLCRKIYRLVYLIKTKNITVALFLISFFLSNFSICYSLSPSQKADSFLFGFSHMNTEQYVYCNLDIEMIRKELKILFRDYVDKDSELAKSIVSLFRNNGVFLETYRLRNKHSLYGITAPFLFYNNEDGYCVMQTNHMQEKSLF